METVLAFLVGFFVAAAVYLMLSRNLLRFMYGLFLLSNAANLVIFASGRLTREGPPIIPGDAKFPVEVIGNPLPQALILTAIVISFGLFAFALVLTYRAYRELGTLDSDSMRVAEPTHELDGPSEGVTPVPAESGARR